MEQLKKQAALKAFEIIKPHLNDEVILGIGTGSTVKYFIEALKSVRFNFKGAVSSSFSSTKLLKDNNIPVFNLNHVDKIEFYIDGADEVNDNFELIKGGGGALTCEKIIAGFSNHFICIVDQSKKVSILGDFGIPLEVLPMARSFVSKKVLKMRGRPILRDNFITDSGNVIIDINDLLILNPKDLETQFNQIPGVVSVGIFAHRLADQLIIASEKEIQVLSSKNM